MIFNPAEQRYRSILCLNGDLPEASFFLDWQLPVIAADGAANRLYQLGISPHIIIGDLDSVDPLMGKNHAVLHCPDQQASDFQKCIQYLRDQSLLPAIILGINGGFLDHVLNNINIFLETDSVLYAPPLVGQVLKENSRQGFSLPLNSKISLFGIPSALVTTKGLKWDLNESMLAFPGSTSCFNRSREPSIEIWTQRGSVLVLVYLETVSDAGSIYR